MKTVPVSVRVETSLSERLNHLCFEYGVSKNDLLKKILLWGIEKCEADLKGDVQIEKV